MTGGGVILGLLVAALSLIPLERLFALHPGQKLFRAGWRTDLVHFLFTPLLTNACGVLVFGLLLVLMRRAISPDLQAWVASQSRPLQFAEALVLANFGGYVGHRLAHRVPLFWRFHAVHHSSEQMDWLAAARAHPLDQVLIRAPAVVPLYLLGFSKATFGAYLGLAALHAVFIHANVRTRWGALRLLVTTPEYHHWHHSADPAARDKNFAGELPLFDWLFGTLYLPKHRTPVSYGTSESIPTGYVRQLLYPFQPRSGTRVT